MIARTIRIALSFLLVSGLSSPGVLAKTSHESEPEKFQRTGTVDLINNSGKTIVVNDMEYYVSPMVDVHSPSMKHTSMRHAVKVGARVGYKVVGEGPNSRGEITEIWVLPKNFKIQSEE